MKSPIFVAALLLTAVGGAQAQTPLPASVPSFDEAVYITCRDAQAMPVEARKQVAIFLAEHSARHHGIMLPDDERGGQLALLVRGGCTLSPDAYLFTVIDRAIVAEMAKFPKRQ